MWRAPLAPPPFSCFRFLLLSGSPGLLWPGTYREINNARPSMDVHNTGQSLVAHSITCCVQPNTVPKRPATLAAMAGVEWSRIAKMKVLLSVCPAAT